MDKQILCFVHKTNRQSFVNESIGENILEIYRKYVKISNGKNAQKNKVYFVYFLFRKNL